MESLKLHGLLPEVPNIESKRRHGVQSSSAPHKRRSTENFQLATGRLLKMNLLFRHANGIRTCEWDRRAFAAANPERNMVKRNKLSARKDGQDLINEMDPASR